MNRGRQRRSEGILVQQQKVPQSWKPYSVWR